MEGSACLPGRLTDTKMDKNASRLQGFATLEARISVLVLPASLSRFLSDLLRTKHRSIDRKLISVVP